MPADAAYTECLRSIVAHLLAMDPRGGQSVTSYTVADLGGGGGQGGQLPPPFSSPPFSFLLVVCVVTVLTTPALHGARRSPPKYVAQKARASPVCDSPTPATKYTYS